MARNGALPILTAEPDLTHYLEEIRRFPMLEPHEEYMLAKSWREHGDRGAAHKLVTSHLRLVAKIARDYRGYGVPISEAISEGNVGLMQAVERFRAGKRLPPRHLCHVVDQGDDPGIHLALVVPGEDGHHGQSEEAVLQPAQGPEQNLYPRRWRYAAGPGEDHRPADRRHRPGRDPHEPAARRRCLAQRRDPRGRRFRRVARPAGGRIPGPGDDAGRERGVR